MLEARKLFGTTVATKNMRRQWVSQTYELTTRGIHLLQTGKFPGKVPSKDKFNELTSKNFS